MKKVSVIVPVFKVEKYISECIESILNQSYSNIELLLIDDGSPDNSGKICDRYATIDKRVHVIHQTNQGVSRSRNAALRIAQGEWVTFVDSDDTINTDYIENLVNSNSTFDKWTLSIGGATRIDRNTNTCRWKRVFDNRKIQLNSLSNEDYKQLDSILLFGTILGKLYNLDIIRSNSLQFHEQLPLNEDHLFFFEYLKFMNTIVTNNNAGYNYYTTDGSASLSARRHHYNKRIIAYKEIHKAYLALLNKFNIQPTALIQTSSMVYSIYIDAIRSCYVMKENQSACLQVLRNLNRSEMRNWYSPKSKKGRIMKYIISFPDFIIHLILKSIIH